MQQYCAMQKMWTRHRKVRCFCLNHNSYQPFLYPSCFYVSLFEILLLFFHFRSSKTVHDMFLCIGNTNRTTCPICVELLTAGSIKSITEMVLHHEMHKENPGFRKTRVGLLVCFNLIKYVIFFFLLFLNSYKRTLQKNIRKLHKMRS